MKDLEGKVKKLLGSVFRITGKLEVGLYEEKLLADKETQRVYEEKEEKEESRRLRELEKVLARQRELDDKKEQERLMIKKVKKNQMMEIETNKVRDQAILQQKESLLIELKATPMENKEEMDNILHKIAKLDKAIICK